MEVLTVLWREFLFMKKRFFKITLASIIGPLLYMVAFGWGLGSQININGHSYMHFIIPGIIALTTMNTSFNATAIRITTSRLHEKSFEYYLTSPVNMYFLALGQVLAGALRGMYAAGIILLLSYFFGQQISVNPAFILLCVLNSLVFAALGYAAALMIDSHYDMNRFTTYFLVPMTFLCGTFFSLDKVPDLVRKVIYLLPLTHAAQGLRSIAVYDNVQIVSYVILTGYLVVFYFVGVAASYREMQ